MFVGTLHARLILVFAAVGCQSLIVAPSGLDLQPCRCVRGGCDASSPLSRWPKIHLIYGLWDDGPLPSHLESVMQHWKDLNPGWQVNLWNRPVVNDFVHEHFSNWFQAFSSSPPILQSDIFRYMVVLKEGGLYVDFDVPPVALQSALGCSSSRNNATDVFFQEFEIRGALQGKPIREGHREYNHRIANYAFFAGPGSEVLERTLRLVRHRLNTHMNSWGSETPVFAPGPYWTLGGWVSHAANFIRRLCGTTRNVGSTENRHVKTKLSDHYTPLFITGPDALSEAIQGVRFKTFLEENPQDVFGLQVRVCTDKVIRNRNAGGWRKNKKALSSTLQLVEESQRAWCAK